MSKHDQFIRLTHFLFAIKSGLGVKSGWRLDILFTLVLLFIVLETDFLLYVSSPAWISWYIFSTLFTAFRPIKSTFYSVFYQGVFTWCFSIHMVLFELEVWAKTLWGKRCFFHLIDTWTAKENLDKNTLRQTVQCLSILLILYGSTWNAKENYDKNTLRQTVQQCFFAFWCTIHFPLGLGTSAAVKTTERRKKREKNT